MKVAIVSSEGLAGRGGIQRTIEYLLTYVRSVPSSIEVVSLQTRQGSSPLVRHASTAFQLPAAVVVAALGGYDLIHVNVAPRGSTLRKLLFCAALHVLGKPYIIHLHGSGYDSYYTKQPIWLRRRIRGMFERSKAVIALGEFWRAFLQDQLSLPPSQIRVIYNE